MKIKTFKKVIAAIIIVVVLLCTVYITAKADPIIDFPLSDSVYTNASFASRRVRITREESIRILYQAILEREIRENQQNNIVIRPPTGYKPIPIVCGIYNQLTCESRGSENR